MLPPVAMLRQPETTGWAGVRRELWRASRVKLLVLFVLLCWTVGLTFGGPRGLRSDAGDLSVVPGHAPAHVTPGSPCPVRDAGVAGSCR